MYPTEACQSELFDILTLVIERANNDKQNSCKKAGQLGSSAYTTKRIERNIFEFTVAENSGIRIA